MRPPTPKAVLLSSLLRDRRTTLPGPRADRSAGDPDPEIPGDRIALAREWERLQKEREQFEQQRAEFEDDLRALEEQRKFLDEQREKIRADAAALDARRDELVRTKTTEAAEAQRSRVETAIEDARKLIDRERQRFRSEMASAMGPRSATSRTPTR